MRFINSFKALLEDLVNLSHTRVDKANDTFDTLTSFFTNADATKDVFVATTRQGSLRQGTIIRPRAEDAEFDVDMLLRMKHVEDWHPLDYLNAVSAAFASSERYQDLLLSPPSSRCETIDYAGDSHVDVVPSIEYGGQAWIMNRTTNKFEPTDGDGYAAWFNAQNAKTGGQLVRVVRLAKYLRDEHEWPIKSILLTTMLAGLVRTSDTPAVYPDTPTALRVLFDRWDAWLQAQQTLPKLKNPAMPAETFDRHWTVETFNKVKAGVHALALAIRTAYNSTDEEVSVEEWRKAFGDGFPVRDEDLKGGEAVAAAHLALGPVTHARPISDIAQAQQLKYKVRIDAWVYNKAGTKSSRGINSGAKIASDRAIQYRAVTNTPEPFDVHWQVVNTGGHAASEVGGLRGTFQKGKNLKRQLINKLRNWETSKYTGTHWIECFVVKDGVVVARDRFYLNIKNPAY